LSIIMNDEREVLMGELERLVPAMIFLLLFIAVYFIAGEFLYSAGADDQRSERDLTMTVSVNE